MDDAGLVAGIDASVVDDALLGTPEGGRDGDLGGSGELCDVETGLGCREIGEGWMEELERVDRADEGTAVDGRGEVVDGSSVSPPGIDGTSRRSARCWSWVSSGCAWLLEWE